MESLMQDIRYALRTTIKYPAFTVIAVLALTLGIGANTALFSVVYAILLRPLPYEVPERLVVVQERSPKVEAMSVSYPNFLDYRERNHVFEQMVCVRWRGLDLTGVNEPERIENYQVSAGFFETLGIRPIYGRTFLPEEDRPDGRPVVIIGDRLWERQFQSDPNALNKVITLNGIGFTIIGIMPPGFQYPGQAESWTPIGRVAPSLQDRGVHEGLSVLARLKPNVSIQQAQAEMDNIASQLEQEYKETNEGVGVTASLLTESMVRDIKPSLIVLLGAVGFVLLIACANVANLLLARAAARQKEMAIRMAMGAGRSRIIRQLLTESVSMSLLGGVFGSLLAWGAINVLKAITPVTGNIPRLQEVRIEWRVLIFTFIVSIVTGVIFGLVPAIKASKPNLTDSLKEGGRSVAGSSRNWLRNLLVVAEVALSLVVLIGGGLMLKGFVHLINIDPGFRADNVLVMDIALPPARYTDGEHQRGFYDELIKRIQSVPGVQSASLVNPLPISGYGNQISSLQEGVPFARENIVTSDFLVTSSDYFQAMSIPLMKGRNFTEFDNPNSPLVIVVDEVTAERFWPGQDPIGKRMAFELEETGDGPPRPIWREVIGVVGHVKHYGLTSESRQQIYVSYRQMPNMYQGLLPPMSLVIRSNANQQSVVNGIRSEVANMDKNLPLYNISSMDQLLSDSVARTRLAATLMGSFAVVGLLLAAIGIFGVISHSVTQRVHEIGVRMALGARQGQVLRMVVGQGMGLVIAGLVIGIGVSLLLTPVLSSMIFAVSATDLTTYAGFSILLAIVALAACYLPARRATRVDPLIALRNE